MMIRRIACSLFMVLATGFFAACVDDGNGGDAALLDAGDADTPLFGIECGGYPVAAGDTGTVQGFARFRNTTDHSGIHVYLLPHGYPCKYHAVTAADGSYSIDNITPGSYTINAFTEIPTTEGYDAGEFDVTATGVTTAPDMYMTAMGLVTGTVVLQGATDGNGDVNIFTRDRYATTTTEDDGSFRLTILDAGTYDVCAGMDGYVGVCVDGITVEPGRGSVVGQMLLTPIDPSNPPTGSVSGTVTMIGEADSSGIAVRLADTLLETVTAADGGYLIENVAPGTYDVVFDAPAGSGFVRGVKYPALDVFADLTASVPPRVLGRGAKVGDLNGGLDDVEFSPDSRFLLITSTTNTDVRQLYSYDITADRLVKLADSVWDYAVAPDSSTVAYMIDTDDSTLYRQPIGGGKQTVLATDAWSVEGFTPDSKYVLYDNYTDDYEDLLFAAANGTATKSWELCPDYSYLGVQTTTNPPRVICNDLDGHFRVMSPAGGTPLYEASRMTSLRVTPDEKTMVACRVDRTLHFVDLETGDTTDDTNKLQSCDAFIVTPDSAGVIFCNTDGKLITMPIGGGQRVQIADSCAMPVAVTPDGQKVLYTSVYSQDTWETSWNLHVVSVTGGDAVKISHGSWLTAATNFDSADHNERGFKFSSTSDELFIFDKDDNGCYLDRITLDGLAHHQMMTIACPGHLGWDPTWDARDDLGIAWSISPEGFLQVYDLLNNQLIDIRTVEDFGMMVPDSSGYITAYGDPETIYRVSTNDGSSIPVSLNTNNMLGSPRPPWIFSPDSSYFTYTTRLYTPQSGNDIDLMVVRVEK